MHLLLLVLRLMIAILFFLQSQISFSSHFPRVLGLVPVTLSSLALSVLVNGPLPL